MIGREAELLRLQAGLAAQQESLRRRERELEDAERIRERGAVLPTVPYVSFNEGLDRSQAVGRTGKHDVAGAEDVVELVSVGEPELVELQLERKPAFHEGVSALGLDQRERSLQVDEHLVVDDPEPGACDELGERPCTHALAVTRLRSDMREHTRRETLRALGEVHVGDEVA